MSSRTFTVINIRHDLQGCVHFSNQEQDEYNAALVILLAMELLWTFALIFVVCELGERASLAFREIDCMTGQLNFYDFPYKMKKILPVFMAMVSVPFNMSVFGSLTCGREPFRKVGLFDKSTT